MDSNKLHTIYQKALLNRAEVEEGLYETYIRSANHELRGARDSTHIYLISSGVRSGVCITKYRTPVSVGSGGGGRWAERCLFSTICHFGTVAGPKHVIRFPYLPDFLSGPRGVSSSKPATVFSLPTYPRSLSTAVTRWRALRPSRLSQFPARRVAYCTRSRRLEVVME